MKALRPLCVILLGLPILCTSVAAQQPRPINVRLIEPTSLPRGKTTSITVIAQGLSNVQSAWIMPPMGLKVVEIKQGTQHADGAVEVNFAISVDAQATPGERALSVQLPGWAFELAKIQIQDHDIRIADLRSGLPRMEPPGDHGASPRRFSFTIFDERNDVFQPDGGLIGEIETRIKCGSQEMEVRGRDLSSYGVSGSSDTPAKGAPESVPTQAVRRSPDADRAGVPPPPQIPATFPQSNPTVMMEGKPRGATVTIDLPGWAGKGPCELRLSVKDKAGNESNALRLATDLK